MLGQRRFTPRSAAACVAMAFAAMACNPDGATTGPTGTQPADFAANLRLVSGDQQLGQLGSSLTLPIVVRVVDAGGQPVQGATVVFSVRAGGGSINPAANISGADGTVSATWTMGSSLGPNRAVALLTNSFLVDSTVFTATATQGPPQKFFKVSGDSQTGPASQELPLALVVKLQDNFGNNLSGIKVTWTPTATSGSVSFITDTSAADGTAAAKWRLGTSATTQNLTATVAGFGTPIIFTAFATADTGRIVTVLSGGGQTAPISSALPTQIRVRVTDRFLNPVAGEPVTFASVTGGGTLNPAAAVTNALGEAATTWTLGSNPGVQTSSLTSGLTTASITATATLAFWDVRAGNFQTCGTATINDRVYCWGLNDIGQLGTGLVGSNTNVPTTPVTSGGSSFVTFRQLTSGESLFCGLTPARALYCWGRLITGSTTSTATLQTITSGGSQATANHITVGEEHMCHLSLPGEGFCTGVNESGQVGNGTFVSTAANAWVKPTAPPATFSALTAGRSHTCGMPRFDGTVVSQQPFCWGLNNAGQVGDGTVANKAVPTAVTGFVPGTVFDSTTLTAGGAHSCAMAVGGATAFCWGNNGFGQLGTGAADNLPHPGATAVANPGAITWAALSAGEYHTCGLSSTGTAYCWGRNDYGQIGIGSRTTSVATPTAVAGGFAFRSISVGELHTCGVVAAIGTPVGPSASAGTVYCWGDNVFGQIGNGSSGNNAPVLTPTRVAFQP